MYTRHDSSNKKYTYLIAILLLVSFVLLAIHSLGLSTDPDYYDTIAYLGEANFIKGHGGLTNFINLCVTGKYTQANQHPLYILIITPFASTDISFLIYAKLISAIIGILAMVVLFLIAKKMFGDLVAAVAVLGMSMNIVFVQWIGIVAVESLLVLLSTITIYFIIEGFKKNKYWTYAGIFAGLTYLSKGTGLVLIPGFVFSAVIVHKFKILRNKFFWYFFVGFAVVSSPLLVRNIVVYDDPFFNVNVYIAKRGYEELSRTVYKVSSSDVGVANWKFEDVEDTKKNTGDESNYIDVVKISNLARKILTETKLFLETVSINYAKRFLTEKYNFLFGFILVSLFLFGLLNVKDTGVKIYLFTTIGLLIFALASVRPIARYLLPVIPFIWIYIAVGIFIAVEYVDKKMVEKKYNFSLLKYIPQILIIISLINLAYILKTKSFSNPFNSVDYSKNRSDLVDWLRTNLDENDKYSLGPGINWQLKEGTWVLPPEAAKKDLNKFQLFIKKHNIDYVIISQNLLTTCYQGRDYSTLGKDHFRLDPEEGIVNTNKVESWNLAYKSKNKPVDYLVYRVNQ